MVTQIKTKDNKAILVRFGSLLQKLEMLKRHLKYVVSGL